MLHLLPNVMAVQVHLLAPKRNGFIITGTFALQNNVLVYLLLIKLLIIPLALDI